MRNQPNAVMIFAAGFGTRMGALTSEQPKPLIKVAGRALIDRTLDLVEAFGPDRVVVNLHYLPDMLRTHLSERDVLFSEEQPEILETGGGLRAALPLLGSDPVFTMNSDAIWLGPNPLTYLLDRWDPDRMDALLLCIPPAFASGHLGAGDFEIQETGEARRGHGVVFSGLQITKVNRLCEIPETVFSLNRLWDLMIEEQSLHATCYPGRWCDVGQPESIALAEHLLGTADV